MTRKKLINNRWSLISNRPVAPSRGPPQATSSTGGHDCACFFRESMCCGTLDEEADTYLPFRFFVCAGLGICLDPFALEANLYNVAENRSLDRPGCNDLDSHACILYGYYTGSFGSSAV